MYLLVWTSDRKTADGRNRTTSKRPTATWASRADREDARIPRGDLLSLGAPGAGDRGAAGARPVADDGGANRGAGGPFDDLPARQSDPRQWGRLRRQCAAGPRARRRVLRVDADCRGG